MRATIEVPDDLRQRVVSETAARNLRATHRSSWTRCAPTSTAERRIGKTS